MKKLTFKKSHGIKIVGNVCIIPLSGGKTSICDKSDFKIISKHIWYAAKSANSDDLFYAYSNVKLKSGEKRTIKMHRIILDLKESEIADHKNHDGLDNRRENLRMCSLSQNAYNKRIQRNNSSGYVGVHWMEKIKKYEAYFWINKKKHKVGYFKDLEEAVFERNKAVKTHHGEFANIQEIKS